MRKLLLLFISVTIVGCSTFVKRAHQTEKEYFEKINNALVDKNVLVHFFNNGNTEGKFIRINSDSLLLQTSDTLELSTKSVHSISYEKSDPSWFVGALIGFASGSSIYAASGARIDLACGAASRNPNMIFVIPASMLIGAIAAESSSGGFKTFILHNPDYNSKRNNVFLVK